MKTNEIARSQRRRRGGGGGGAVTFVSAIKSHVFAPGEKARKMVASLAARTPLSNNLYYSSNWGSPQDKIKDVNYGVSMARKKREEPLLGFKPSIRKNPFVRTGGLVSGAQLLNGREMLVLE